jgi:membrane protein implicated in regulation of membrane protease activity
MEYILDYTAWLVLGSGLMLAEFLIPGAVVVFLGLGAVATSGLIYLGYIREGWQAVTCFGLASVLMLVTIRKMVMRFYPSLTEKVVTDEEKLIYGQKAEVITVLTAHDYSGRVKYSGTTWPARSETGEIAEGATVEIIAQDNINLVVRKLVE